MPAGPNASEPRLALSKQRIMEAAMALADLNGVRGLSMRQIGDHLGVQAMSPLQLRERQGGTAELNSGPRLLVRSGSTFPAETGKHHYALPPFGHDLFLEHPWSCELVLTLDQSGFRPHDCAT